MTSLIDHLKDSNNPGLQKQLAELDVKELSKAIDQCIHQKDTIGLPKEYKPAEFFPYPPQNEEQREQYRVAELKGEEAIRAGKVAAFTVAGGQGTRLGYDGPKGTLSVSPVKGKSLFQIFAEKILGANEKYEVAIPWYIMCSPLNIEATKAFFEAHNYFGLNSKDLAFFAQGVMPATDFDGKLLRASEESLAFSPNGHGGSLKALIDSGSIEDMAKRGVEHLSYFQVDNPLVSVVNPLFIGLHLLQQSDMSSRSLTKTGPFEKLGNFVSAEGKLTIIEYSDLPESKATEKDEKGQLKYRAGSPAIHIIRRDFIEKFANESLTLPYHRAEKKVPFLNEKGEQIKPETPNAIKFETFIFDALPLANNPLILEAQREEEFSPVKNKTGVDSLESSQEDQSKKAVAWLKLADMDYPEGKAIELSGKVCSPKDLKDVSLQDLLKNERVYVNH